MPPDEAAAAPAWLRRRATAGLFGACAWAPPRARARLPVPAVGPAAAPPVGPHRRGAPPRAARPLPARAGAKQRKGRAGPAPTGKWGPAVSPPFIVFHLVNLAENF